MIRVWAKSGLGFGLLIASSAFASEGQAESLPTPPSAPAPPPAASASDVVRFKNGGLLRGTIAELVPKGYVIIITMTGETRKIDFSEIDYAGPASAAPQPATAPAPAAPAPVSAAPQYAAPINDKAGLRPFAVVNAAEAQVDVTSERPNATLFRRNASAGVSGVGIVSGYDEVCTAPCKVTMPSGTHTFAVGFPGDLPREAPPVTLPAGRSTLNTKVVSMAGPRIGLILVGAGATIVGGVLFQQSLQGEKTDSGLLVAGTSLAMLGLLTIVYAPQLRDKATIELKPGAPLVQPARSEQAPASAARSVADGFSGLTLTARF